MSANCSFGVNEGEEKERQIRLGHLRGHRLRGLEHVLHRRIHRCAVLLCGLLGGKWNDGGLMVEHHPCGGF